MSTSEKKTVVPVVFTQWFRYIFSGVEPGDENCQDCAVEDVPEVPYHLRNEKARSRQFNQRQRHHAGSKQKMRTWNVRRS